VSVGGAGDGDVVAATPLIRDEGSEIVGDASRRRLRDVQHAHGHAVRVTTEPLPAVASMEGR
jgi:hypothetical protein